MTSATAFDVKGVKSEPVKLSDKLFGAPADPTLLSQSIRVYLANQRRGMAKTKTRTEVSKTTAKMYKQKGTGRARHGSYAAPIFVGGGISHGPTGEQNYSLTMPAKMKRQALLGALTVRATEKAVYVLTGEDKASGKTKDAAEWIKKTGLTGKILMVVGPRQEKLARAWRNIEGVTVAATSRLHPYLILGCKNLVMSESAMEEAEKLYAI